MHSKLCAQVEYQLPYGEDRQRKGRRGKMEACNENFDTREWVCCTPHSDKWTSLFEVLKVAFEKKKKKEVLEACSFENCSLEKVHLLKQHTPPIHENR